MALLVIVALMTGAIVIMMIFKITRWWEAILIGAWGILSTVAVVNGDLADFWSKITSWAG